MTLVTLCSVVAVLLAIAGVVKIFQGDFRVGIVLLVGACAVGPGGWFIFRG